MADSTPALSKRVWEVERDRHGIMFSEPLEIGDRVQVIPATELIRVIQEQERLRSALRIAAGALEEISRKITPGMRAGTGEAKAMADGHAQQAWEALAR